jgi:hypothetical protein
LLFIERIEEPTKHRWFLWVKVRVMVFNATFNNISVISWRSFLLVEETGVPGENHRHRAGFELTTIVVIGTDYKGSCNFNYHTITIAPDGFQCHNKD